MQGFSSPHSPRPSSADASAIFALGSINADFQVRLAEPLEGGKTLLTFKGPVQTSPMKVREELETVVGDGLLLLKVLEELGG